jgi:hypothetical protein
MPKRSFQASSNRSGCEDQIKTSFITPFGAFCYTTMGFGLKSTGATYQRGIHLCLHSQIGCNTEAYIDDVVVNTWEDEGLISDLAKTFDNLRKFKMKLLGYMVSHHGINPNQEKVSAITKMKPPEILQDIQKLTGCMASLSRFTS